MSDRAKTWLKSMLYKRLVLSLLLIAVPLVGLTPQVNSQTFTATTSLNTFTTNVTLTEMNLSTVGRVTTTMKQEATLFATQVTLSGVGGAQGCNEGHFGPFYANATQQISGTLTSTQMINFYIMNSSQYSAWNSATTCAPNPTNGTVYMYEQTNFVALEWRAPKKGLYYFVFVTFSYSDAMIIANLGTPIHVTTSYLQYVTLSNYRTGATTETITSISSTQLTPASQLPAGLIEFILVILTGLGAVGLWKRRRGKS
jgi:hypothetical protein